MADTGPDSYIESDDYSVTSADNSMELDLVSGASDMDVTVPSGSEMDSDDVPRPRSRQQEGYRALLFDREMAESAKASHDRERDDRAARRNYD